MDLIGLATFVQSATIRITCVQKWGGKAHESGLKTPIQREEHSQELHALMHHPLSLSISNKFQPNPAKWFCQHGHKHHPSYIVCLTMKPDWPQAGSQPCSREKYLGYIPADVYTE